MSTHGTRAERQAHDAAPAPPALLLLGETQPDEVVVDAVVTRPQVD
jgi:hypothetical protein